MIEIQWLGRTFMGEAVLKYPQDYPRENYKFAQRRYGQPKPISDNTYHLQSRELGTTLRTRKLLRVLGGVMDLDLPGDMVLSIYDTTGYLMRRSRLSNPRINQSPNYLEIICAEWVDNFY